MHGHLFITRGDVTRLACDAWLVPGDRRRHVTRGWWVDHDPDLCQALERGRCWFMAPLQGALGFPLRDGQRALPLPGLPLDRPQVWMVDVGGHRRKPVDWYLDAVGQALDALEPVLAQGPRYLRRRARPLVALPVVGTGFGGQHHDAGAMIRAMVPWLTDQAAQRSVDLALVTFSAADFAAARACRTPTWADLPDAAATEAQRLATLAAAGELVIFFGAGLSAGANLPTWFALLDDLATEAGLSDEARALLLHDRVNAMDRGQLLATHLDDVGAAVQRLLQPYKWASLAHTLLAGLPVDSAITTNYDTLYEQACTDAGRPLAVLPYAPAARHPRWLLKMHGCLNHPEDIVLTRENYMRYGARNAALAGIVQSMLMTRHMLFLGFSLEDDNFLRIVDAVRQAARGQLPGEGQRQEGPSVHLGTAVMLSRDPLLEALWQGEMDWLDMSAGEPVGIAESARRFELFLDCLSHHTTAHSHLLAPRFHGALSAEDQALRDLLMPLLAALPSDARAHSPAWAQINRLLARLGAPHLPED
ncbi:MAG: SIR2 family protein [Bradymonadia bacterium]